MSIHLHIAHGCFQTTAELNFTPETAWPTKSKIFTTWPFTEECSKPCSRAVSDSKTNPEGKNIAGYSHMLEGCFDPWIQVCCIWGSTVPLDVSICFNYFELGFVLATKSILIWTSKTGVLLWWQLTLVLSATKEQKPLQEEAIWYVQTPETWVPETSSGVLSRALP